MKLFEVIISDGENVFKTCVAGKNKKHMLDVYGGNGKFEKITDITKEHLIEGSAKQLDSDLQKLGWGKGERTIICALVEEHINKR